MALLSKLVLLQSHSLISKVIYWGLSQRQFISTHGPFSILLSTHSKNKDIQRIWDVVPYELVTWDFVNMCNSATLFHDSLKKKLVARLTWFMPGGNTLVVHMKDHKKTRSKKRWSQVMYMYFLLGFRLMGRFQSKLLENLTQDKRGRGRKAISREDGMFFKVIWLLILSIKLVLVIWLLI